MVQIFHIIPVEVLYLLLFINAGRKIIKTNNGYPPFKQLKFKHLKLNLPWQQKIIKELALHLPNL